LLFALSLDVAGVFSAGASQFPSTDNSNNTKLRGKGAKPNTGTATTAEMLDDKSYIEKRAAMTWAQRLKRVLGAKDWQKQAGNDEQLRDGLIGLGVLLSMLKFQYRSEFGLSAVLT
jgi:hypothetical protein